MAAVTCPQIRELFSARVDEALTADERARLDAHLASCPDCALEWQRFEGTVGLLRAATPAQAPVGFVDRVLAARPLPWHRRLARGALMPWPVKLPLDAAAIVLVAGLAVLVFHRSPEMRQAVLMDESRRDASQAAPEPAAPAPAARPEENAAAPATPAPAKPKQAFVDESKERARNLESQRVLTARQERRAPAAEAPRPSADTTRPPTDDWEKRDAPTLGAAEPGRGKDSGARAVRPAAPPASAEPSRKSELKQLSAVRADVQGRLVPSGDRETAERSVRELVTRAGGSVRARTDEPDATLLRVLVPRDRWDELLGGLRELGSLQIEGAAVDAPGQIPLTLRLQR
jgi:hypothetical protein